MICLCIITYNSFGQDIEVAGLEIGQQISFNSKILDEERILNVYLPPSYNDSLDRNFPVIYLLDGTIDEDFIHVVGLVQFCSFNWVNIIEESIVVGIANVDRKRDFTFPSKNKLDQEEFPTSGKSKDFIQFLNEEVKHIINQNYRTNASSTIIGQSLGGLLVTEILMFHPEYFDNYIIISPSLWWDDQSILNHDLPLIGPPKKIYIAVGNEGPTMEATSMRLIAKTQGLRRRETDDSLIVRYDILKDANHGNIMHQAIYDAFKSFAKF